MFKKIFVLLLLIFPISIFASNLTGVGVGNLYFDTLEEAIGVAKNGDVIKLFSDTTIEDTLLIDKDIIIDLNGNDIVSDNTLFIVNGGKLKIIGSGTLKEEKPNYGVIKVIGSNDSNDKEYSVVEISNDVTLEGWAGINISHDNFKSHGVLVNFSGNINAVNDINNDTGIGIYVNGNIQDKINHPVINILDGAAINSTGNGLYIAGDSTFNIGKANISGIEAGVGMKAGTLNINGTSIYCSGLDKTPTSGNNNGIKPSGTTIQLESNDSYAGDMEININGGNFKSKNSNVIYEYIGKGNDSLVKSINILNGTFISEKKDVFNFSNEFENIHSEFISGGAFSSNPDNYLKSGYKSSMIDNMYNVTSSVLKEVGLFNNGSFANSFFLEIAGVFFAILMICGILYINRRKILKLF